MNFKLKKARSFFPHVYIDLIDMCSVDRNQCRKCDKDCICRFLAVRSKTGGKIIAWFEGEMLLKTNARPSKRYLRKYLGVRPSERRGRSGNTELGRRTDQRGDQQSERQTKRNKRPPVQNRTTSRKDTK